MPSAGAGKFCPRCGLPLDTLASEQSVTLHIGPGQSIRVGRRLAFGDLCNLYGCTLEAGGRQAVFKIARSHLANAHLANETEMLNRLHAADPQRQAAPFLPRPLATAAIQAPPTGKSPAPPEPWRTASVLGYHEGINHADELYTLEEVRAAYPDGMDARDMAWMWRRLLTILSFIHAQDIVHGGVTPDHVLIEPREHKLVLIGWCGAMPFGMRARLSSPRWRHWSNFDNGAAPITDLSAGAKSMLHILRNADEPVIVRHLERAGESSSNAGRILEDFDKLIETLWGPRQFRSFSMPPRAS